ncbi:site-specific tyrosine recombinase XerC [Shewanella sp. Shew256]|jgi:integrase/recombinase XerD|uniref:site-specific tyrosine recombinase XerC n=1 Tax=Shewanella sp. Shew256 TaxID=1969376 RepID=UPI000B4A2DF2|nr:site-specific tyrosine recombinase XerC [Shewanella sp. Shew256]
MSLTLTEHSSLYLSAFSVRGYSPRTLAAKRWLLNYFIDYCGERDIHHAQHVDKALLLRYQQHVHHTRKDDGKPLSIATQRHRVGEIQLWFVWLVEAGHLPYTRLGEVVLPKLPKTLPKAVLSVPEIDKLMAQVCLDTPTGLRDRTMMEVLYSCAIRRRELLNLTLSDIDTHRGWLLVREGKGGKDRVVPIGQRALDWVAQYLHDARPLLAKYVTEQALFISMKGRTIHHTTFTAKLKEYTRAAGISKAGGCHAFRHSAATLMLENGADIRHIQAMLGHECLSTTQIYTQVAIGHLKDVHKKTHPGESQ